jgi:hypothetical protein
VSALSAIRLFQAGLAAACLQFAAVLIATIVVFVAARQGLIGPLSSQARSDAGSLLASLFPLLTWMYILTAVGVALTTPNGRRVYVLKYRVNGRQRWFTIGRHGSPDASGAW